MEDLKEFLMKAQESLHNLRLVNNLTLTQKLDKAIYACFAYVSDSFKDALWQVEHLYYPFHISREQFHPYQVVEDGKAISLREQSYESVVDFLSLFSI